MTVSARPAEDLPSAATAWPVDQRTSPEVRAGTFPWEGPDLDTGWHVHPYHQIEYAFEGIAEVETPAGRYLLPPQQAIWVPAGLPHATSLHRVRSVAVFFEPDMVRVHLDHARVLAAVPVIREMILHGRRWDIARPPDEDDRAERYFDVLAGLVADWLDHEVPLHLPTTTDPLLAAVMAHTDAHLGTVTVAGVCDAVGVSERTLRRRFPADVGMTWRAYLLQARLVRAAALLTQPDRSVIDVANDVGFTSPSAFTRAFTAWIGETPSAYRRTARLDER